MSCSTVSLTGKYALNGNGSLKVGGSISTTTTAAYSGGEELNGFKSGNLSISASSVDNSARGDGGWAVNGAGSRSATLEITFNRILGDTAQDFLLALFTADQDDFLTQGVAICYETGDGTNTRQVFGTFVPTDLTQNQTGGGDADGTAEEVSITFSNYGALYSSST